MPPQQFPKEGAAPQQQQPCPEQADSAIWGPVPLPHPTRLLAQACWQLCHMGPQAELCGPHCAWGWGGRLKGTGCQVTLPCLASYPIPIPTPPPHCFPSLLQKSSHRRVQWTQGEARGAVLLSCVLRTLVLSALGNLIPKQLVPQKPKSGAEFSYISGGANGDHLPGQGL